MANDLCIVAGLSGAGKTTALAAFEDLGFFTVDGLPASLSPDMAAMLSKPAMQRFKGIAIGMDMRETDFIEQLRSALLDLAPQDLKVRLVFLDANNSELTRRYAATRRPHPYEHKGIGLAEAISCERKDLEPLREMADLIIDSSAYSIHDLRREIQRLFAALDEEASRLKINLLSFGFKYGIPQDADFVLDARFLDNPYFAADLRHLSGLDKAIVEYVFASGAAGEYLRLLTSLFKFVFTQMELDGRSRVTIAIGCTGGRHRSVALAEKLRHELGTAGYRAIIEHRNIGDDIKQAEYGK